MGAPGSWESVGRPRAVSDGCGGGNHRGKPRQGEADMAEAKTTTNHDEIRRWAEERGGLPAAVRDTGRADDPGILRINFTAEPGGDDDDRLEEISWDEWF